jgi:RimJ/RimL family protein N-acetyltransferase
MYEKNTVVGTCTLADIDHVNRRAELGFVLARAFWGQGYTAVALPAVIDFSFHRLELHRLQADTDPRNGPSMRLLQRCGFRREGLLREHYLVQGGPNMRWCTDCCAPNGHEPPNWHLQGFPTEQRRVNTRFG